MGGGSQAGPCPDTPLCLLSHFSLFPLPPVFLLCCHQKQWPMQRRTVPGEATQRTPSNRGRPQTWRGHSLAGADSPGGASVDPKHQRAWLCRSGDMENPLSAPVPTSERKLETGNENSRPGVTCLRHKPGPRVWGEAWTPPPCAPQQVGEQIRSKQSCDRVQLPPDKGRNRSLYVYSCIIIII